EASMSILAGTPREDQSASLDEILKRPGQAAVYAHQGALGDLAALLPAGSVDLVLAVVPRPNPALRSLSAVWAAWLWGRKSAGPMGAALRRRRYDWSWHARAVQRSLAAAKVPLKPGAPLAGILGEAEPNAIAGILAAAAGAGLRLEGWALCADTAEAQYVWRPAAAVPDKAADKTIRQTARAAGTELLRSRGEPTRWIMLHGAAWAGLAQAGHLPWVPADPLGPVNRALQPVWDDRGTFQRLEAAPDDESGIGLWYLAQPREASSPLGDRVELEVVRHLAPAMPVEAVEVLRLVGAAFAGQQTPERGFVLACLSAYAVQDSSGLWQLRPEDLPAARAEEQASLLTALRTLAARQGFDATDGNPQVWREPCEAAADFQFVVLTSAVISPYLLEGIEMTGQRFLVLPGGRAGLVEAKLRRDPRLRAALQNGNWTLVKYRQIRRMLLDANLTRTTLGPALAGDPLEAMEQLALIK
ncbi:MAG: hypothetical protein ABI847_13890, partial [Anaerolineales bacterium]